MFRQGLLLSSELLGSPEAVVHRLLSILGALCRDGVCDLKNAALWRWQNEDGLTAFPPGERDNLTTLKEHPISLELIQRKVQESPGFGYLVTSPVVPLSFYIEGISHSLYGLDIAVVSEPLRMHPRYGDNVDAEKRASSFVSFSVAATRTKPKTPPNPALKETLAVFSKQELGEIIWIT